MGTLLHKSSFGPFALAAFLFPFALNANPVKADTTIDTSSSWDGVQTIGPWGEPNTATFGQTFTAPGGSLSQLLDFEFYVTDDTGRGQIPYEAWVYAWDGSETVGNPLYESGLKNTGLLSDSFTTLHFDTGATSLTPGQQYVLLLSTSGVQDRKTLLADWAYTGADADPGGGFVFLNSGNDADHFDQGAWGDAGDLGDSPTFDLAYRADFRADDLATPEPSGLVALSLGGILLAGFAARSRRRLAVGLGALGSASCFSVPAAHAVGTWTPLTNPAPEAIGTALLLTDGRVMAQCDGQKRWYALTPDASGSYANGTWSSLAPMHYDRLYYSSAVLRDGTVYVAGGEYSADGGDDNALVERYDPVTDHWTDLDSPPDIFNLGDAPMKVLADGRVLQGDLIGYATDIYDPASNTWTSSAYKEGRADEESWVLLPDNSVLTIETFNPPYTEKYLPNQDVWVTAGQTPVDIVQTSSYEIGPGVLLPTGDALFLGATGHSALYTPPGILEDPGVWTAGPDVPHALINGVDTPLEAKDAPACLLTNGNVLCVVGPHGEGAFYPAGQYFYEYQTASKTFAPVPAPPSTWLQQNLLPAYTARLLALPNGQVLYSNSLDSQLFVYTPDGSPSPAWRPAISRVVSRTDGSFQAFGTQFNGLSEASAYGDDVDCATNYPLVRLTGMDGSVTYARTYNHSTMGVATGATPVSTSFRIPESFPAGVYGLQVVANGIASAPVPFVQPLSLSGLALPKAPAVSGGTVNLLVTLNGVTPARRVIALASSDPCVRTPGFAVIPPGQSSVSVPLTILPVTATHVVTIRAFQGRAVRKVTLTVNP